MTVLPVVALLLAPLAGTPPDSLYAVEVFGVRAASEASVRAAIAVKAGERVPASTEAIAARVRAVAGIAEVDVSVVCCSETGGSLLYVGVREAGTPPLAWRPPPTGTQRLPTHVLALGARFDSALRHAVQRGDSEEDGSRGYALARDSATRAVQEGFIAVAAGEMPTLAGVLRHSGDASHRALAARILAYGPDRAQVVRELLPAISDASDEVRNNAARALAVLAGWANDHPDAGVVIPAGAFIDFLNAVRWTDRNKGAFALLPLTARRDPALLVAIRARALRSLVEMARWRNAGHALAPYLILARVIGIDDGEAFRLWQAGERESVIARAAAGDWANLARYRDANAALGAPAPGTQRVVFMGNSITEGWAPHFPTHFPGKPYVGRGIGGQTTPQMLVRFRQDVIALHPAAVVILAGTNDIAGNTGPSTLEMIQDNLASMTELAMAHGIRVVLSSVLPVHDYPWRPGLEPAPRIVALNAWIRRYAAERGAVYLDYHSAMADARQGMRDGLAYDGVHPNEAGYRLMAQLAERAIAEALRQR